MKTFIVSGAPADSSLYLEEILGLFGPPCVQCVTLSEALQRADITDVLIIPHGGETLGVESFLEAGGSVVAIRPDNSLSALAGLRDLGVRMNPGRLRIVAPLCAGARGESLWVLGDQTLYGGELPDSEQAERVLAYLMEAQCPDSESPGIYRCPVGAGVLTIFGYDPAVCIARLRQGYPERAGMLPAGEMVPRSTYLHKPDAPTDTHWRPTADLHALAFCDVVRDAHERYSPVPTIWHIPEGKPSILLFTGDEDGATQEDNQAEFADLESYGGTMSLYVIPGQGTSITSENIADYRRRGHEISVHPDLTPECGRSVAELLAKAEADVLRFRTDYGQPVETIRNHCVVWPGYLDLPELWERLGIGMDASTLLTLYRQSPDEGPYVNGHAGLPLRFVREDGSLIDVLQQPTQVSDDLYCHPTLGYSQKYSAVQFGWVVRHMLEDAARWFHVPHCPIIHPGNYVTFGREHSKAYMRCARDLDIPIWPLDRWQKFWRARALWRTTNFSWRDGEFRFDLAGPACEGLFVTLPVTYGDLTLTSLRVDLTAVEFGIVERFQRPVAQFGLSAQESKVLATYS